VSIRRPKNADEPDSQTPLQGPRAAAATLAGFLTWQITGNEGLAIAAANLVWQLLEPAGSVNGHEILPTGGQENCPPVAMRSAR
jgi:hypothetical protein